LEGLGHWEEKGDSRKSGFFEDGDGFGRSEQVKAERGWSLGGKVGLEEERSGGSKTCRPPPKKNVEDAIPLHSSLFPGRRKNNFAFISCKRRKSIKGTETCLATALSGSIWRMENEEEGEGTIKRGEKRQKE